MKFVELNHLLIDGMDAYPGLPSPKFSAVLDHEHSRERYAHKAEFYLGKIEMPGNVGTYLDSPFHRFPDQADLSKISLDRVAALQGIVLRTDVSSHRAITATYDPSLLRGKAVLFMTGWDQRWGTQRYWEPGPYLASETLDLLVEAKPLLVGVDFWNVDDTGDPARPAHTRLLGAGILIVEHMCNLAELPVDGFEFHAVPLRIAQGASVPVRAFAILRDAT